MDRRGFVRTLGAGTLSALLPQPSRAAAASGSPSDAHAAAWDRTLFLIELKGGNDGLNTVVPYAQDAYYRLRPRLAIARDEVLRLGPDTGLHPALRPLLPVWEAGELAIIQGLGYPDPNLSHFRSIEIWDTASGASEVRSEGWLARA
ncbi:MAG TPA: Twin-arginine translocation pathway signal sequence domain-containing protein, partial [Rhodocyclaceae bacterium]|nr:Twin-arginine translocation pathway signal sequence domain-containing protein [Rhodocyclaceae bacterium]